MLYDYIMSVEQPNEITFRDKSGRIISKDEWELQNSQLNKNKHTKPPPQDLYWSRGLVQIEQEKQKNIEEEELMKADFTRRDIDPKLDDELRNMVRFQTFFLLF